jgi:hypothetical protein
MLLPALSKARAAAQKIKCVSNLKQLGLVTHMYAVDNDDYVTEWGTNYIYPYTDLENGKSAGKVWNEIKDYATVHGVFNCPSNPSYVFNGGTVFGYNFWGGDTNDKWYWRTMCQTSRGMAVRVTDAPQYILWSDIVNRSTQPHAGGNYGKLDGSVRSYGIQEIKYCLKNDEGQADGFFWVPANAFGRTPWQHP